MLLLARIRSPVQHKRFYKTTTITSVSAEFYAPAHESFYFVLNFRCLGYLLYDIYTVLLKSIQVIKNLTFSKKKIENLCEDYFEKNGSPYESPYTSIFAMHFKNNHAFIKHSFKFLLFLMLSFNRVKILYFVEIIKYQI